MRVVERDRWLSAALEITTKKLGPRWSPTLKSWGPHSKVGGQVSDFDCTSQAKFTYCNFSTPSPKISVDEMCERRRRERNFCYIFQETLILIPFVTKRWGPRWPPSPKRWGPIQKDGGHWPLGPRLFPSLLFTHPLFNGRILL